MFEQASRRKLRYNYKGTVSVEDLWDLPLTSLDEIYKDLHKQQEKSQEESLLKTRTPANTELTLKIDVLKHVVEVRLEEQQVREKAKERAEEKKKLLGILAEKETEDLKNLPAKKLKEMINKLDD